MRIIPLLFFIISLQFSFAQSRNAVWCFGDSAGIDFNNINSPLPIGSSLDTRGSCVSICDSLGNILFYSNTIQGNSISMRTLVWNSSNNLMLNGDSIVGEGWYNELMIIPFPGSDSLYYLFCVDVTGGTGYYGFYYSLIDMSKDGGLGAVAQKNVRLDTVPMYDAMAAVKHANGRDWWLIAKDYATFGFSNKFHIYLITPDTILYTTQNIGGLSFAGLGNMTFSKDGTKFLFTTYHQLTEVLNFDRCTGIFSNPLIVKPEQSPMNYGLMGSAFSPDGNVIYVSLLDTVSYLFQYDLTAANIPSSKDTLYVFTNNPYSAGALRLAPDDKIYLTTIDNFPAINNYPYPDSVRSMYNENLSVINNPDVAGSGCNFTPYSFYLGSKRTYWGLPNNPNYDMQAEGGTVCDSLGLPNVVSNPVSTYFKGVLFPNPAKDETYYSYSLHDGQKGNVQVSDQLGRSILYYTLDVKTNLLKLNTRILPDGVYYANVIVDGNVIQKEKLVIIR